jgi:hypothetical protein
MLAESAYLMVMTRRQQGRNTKATASGGVAETSQPPGPASPQTEITELPQPSGRIDAGAHVPPKTLKFTEAMQAALERAKQCLAAARNRAKAYADKSRRELTLNVGDQVLLNSRNIAIKSAPTASPKLLPKYIGPFKVLKQINQVAYKLELPAGYRIHDVFHVSLLKPYRDGGGYKPPLPELINGQLEYEVETILNHRPQHITAMPANHDQRRRVTYLVKWLGYSHEHNSWEPTQCLEGCPEKLQEYWTVYSRLHGDEPKPKKLKTQPKAKKSSTEVKARSIART